MWGCEGHHCVRLVCIRLGLNQPTEMDTSADVECWTWIILVSLRHGRPSPQLLSSAFTRTTLASAGISCRTSVRPFVTSRCSNEIAKRRITQTKPQDSPGTLVFWCRKYRQNSNGVTPTEASNAGGAWDRLKYATFDKKTRYNLNTSTVSSVAKLVWWQVTSGVQLCLQHVCRDAMRRVRVRLRQLLLV